MKRSLSFAVLLVLAAAAAEARDSYVLHFGAGNSTTMSGSLEDFTALKGTITGDYLWVRRDGRRYVITDRAKLAEAWDYFAPERELRPQQREIERETRKLERESDALEDADRKLTANERARLDDCTPRNATLAAASRRSTNARKSWTVLLSESCGSWSIARFGTVGREC